MEYAGWVCCGFGLAGVLPQCLELYGYTDGAHIKATKDDHRHRGHAGTVLGSYLQIGVTTGAS